jgi:spore germination protein (amino acid permease)
MSPEWGHVGQAELVAALTILIGGKIFLSYPASITERALNSGWLAATIGAGVAALGTWVLISLMNRFPDYSLARVSTELAGRYLGTLMNLLLSVFFLVVAALILRESAETLIIGILPLTPLSVLVMTMLIVVAYGAYLGIEAVSRVCFLLGPWLLAGLIIIFLGVARFYDFSRLLPVLSQPPLELTVNGVTRSSLYVEVVAIAFLYPSIRNKKKIFGSAMTSLGLSWVLIAGTPALVVSAFGVIGAARTSFPMYYMARLIEFGRFVQRVEAVFVFLWFFTAGLKVTVAFYVAAVAVGETLHLPNYRPLVPAMAILLYTVAFLPPSYVATAGFEANVFRNFGGLLGFGAPLILWVIALATGKRQEGAGPAEGKNRAGGGRGRGAKADGG